MDTDILMAAIRRKTIEAVEQAQRGPHRMIKVVVGTDGEPYVSESVSRERGEAEYYGRVPHPLTVWEVGTPSLECGPDDRDDEALWDGIEAEVRTRVEEWLAAGNVPA